MDDDGKTPEDEPPEPAREAAQDEGAKLREVSEEELKQILAAHETWLETDGGEGERADLSRTELQGANLIGANLQRASLTFANLQGANLQEASLYNANFQGAKLSNANLQEANLRSANLEGTDLRDAKLQGAELSGANLQNANLHYTNFRSAQLLDANLQGADLLLADFQEAFLIRANLQDVIATGAKLRAAHLIRTNLENAKLSDADFRNADLSDARLSNVIGLRADQLAGADVSNAKLPDDIAKFETLDHVAEISKHARNNFLAVLGACVFSWLTIATTTDAALLANRTETALPIIGTKIPIAGFYLAAPFILLSLYLYLHIYLQMLWEGLAKLPAVFKDGTALNDKAYPWLLTCLTYLYIPRLKDRRPPLWWLQVGLSVVAAWMLVPFTLLLFWWRYVPRFDWLPAHGPALPFVQFFVVVLSIWIGLQYYRIARKAFVKHFANYFPWRANGPAIVCVTLLVLFAYYFTVFVDHHSDADFANGEFSDADLKNSNLPGANFRAANLQSADLRNANLQLTDLKRADLRGADLTDAKLQGANLREAKLQGADLTNAKLQGADLIRANLQGVDLRDANLKEADLRSANLEGADLRNANLEGADLFHANLKGADLRNAHLTNAKNLARKRLDEACGDEGTMLPNNLDNYFMKACPKLD